VLRCGCGAVEYEAGEDRDGGIRLFHARETGYLTADSGEKGSGQRIEKQRSAFSDQRSGKATPRHSAYFIGSGVQGAGRREKRRAGARIPGLKIESRASQSVPGWGTRQCFILLACVVLFLSCFPVR
jgi:hypothetical protein